MIKAGDITAALSQLGLETSGAGAYGVWKGYAVSIMPLQGNYILRAAVRTERKDKSVISGMKKSLNERAAKGFAACANNGTDIAFTVRVNGREPLSEQFRARLDAMADELRSRDLRPADTCLLCGAAGPESLFMTPGTGNQPVHRNCLQRQSQQLRDEAEDNQNNGSYITGLFGALLGALAGVGVNVLVAMLTDSIFALLFALVPLAAMWGYRKLRGRQNAGAIVIVVVLSVLSVFMMNALIVALSVAKEMSIPFGYAIRLTMQYLLTGEGFSALLSDSGVSFFFMLLGILIAWRQIRTTNASTIKNLDAAMETVRPNPDLSVEN